MGTMTSIQPERIRERVPSKSKSTTRVCAADAARIVSSMGAKVYSGTASGALVRTPSMIRFRDFRPRRASMFRRLCVSAALLLFSRLQHAVLTTFHLSPVCTPRISTAAPVSIGPLASIAGARILQAGAKVIFYIYPQAVLSLLHLLAKTQRTHVRPDFLHVIQALLLRAYFSGVFPTRGNFPITRPDGILFFVIHNHPVLPVFIVHTRRPKPVSLSGV